MGCFKFMFIQHTFELSSLIGLNILQGFGFGQPCILESIAFPTRNPLYSCGLVVSGSQACGSGEHFSIKTVNKLLPVKTVPLRHTFHLSTRVQAS